MFRRFGDVMTPFSRNEVQRSKILDLHQWIFVRLGKNQNNFITVFARPRNSNPFFFFFRLSVNTITGKLQYF